MVRSESPLKLLCFLHVRPVSSWHLSWKKGDKVKKTDSEHWTPPAIQNPGSRPTEPLTRAVMIRELGGSEKLGSLSDDDLRKEYLALIEAEYRL